MKLSARQLWLSLALFGISAEFAVIAWMIYDPAITRLCKPVVPQVIVDLGEAGKAKDGRSLFVQYRETTPAPFSQKPSIGTPRFTSCQIKNGRCKASRKRYEVRPEGMRYQSVELYLMDGKAHHVPNRVQWKGSAYPDRVTMRCDLDKSGQPTGCALIEVAHIAELSNPREDREEAAIRRNDKCQPFISRLLHGSAQD
jgi:hypothetical protein